MSIIGAMRIGQEHVLALPQPHGDADIRLHGFRAVRLRLRGGRPPPTTPQQLCELRARIGMVFQSYNLWPHMTVLENVVEAPIRVRRMPRKQAVAEAEALLQRIGLYEKRHAYPSKLSGGQQQRVAIVRALAMAPKVMLFRRGYLGPRSGTGGRGAGADGLAGGGTG